MSKNFLKTMPTCMLPGR